MGKRLAIIVAVLLIPAFALFWANRPVGSPPTTGTGAPPRTSSPDMPGCTSGDNAHISPPSAQETPGRNTEQARPPVRFPVICRKPKDHPPACLLSPELHNPADLPQDIRLILGLEQQTGYEARVHTVHRLGNQLTVQVLQALYWYLLQKETGTLTGPESNALKNDILEVLLRQDGGSPPGLGQLMLTVYEDRQQDPIWRDYVVQHLSMYYQQEWSAVEEAPEGQVCPDRRVLETTLWQAAEEPGDPIAGTALIGLEYLSRQYAHLSRDRVQAVALKLAVSAECDSRTRTTAIQICAQTGGNDVLPIAIEMARDSELSVPLRLAAIAALGSLGTPEHEELLTGLIDENSHADPNSGSCATLLCNAASSALKRIREHRDG